MQCPSISPCYNKNMIIVILIFISIILLLLIFWQFSTIISIFGGVHYVYSGSEIIRESLKIAKAKKEDNFWELGSGFGSGLVIASEEFGLKSVGIEISPFHYLVSKIKTRGLNNIQIILSNIKNINLESAKIVYCYLSPKLMHYLSKKLYQELKPGSIIISNSFPIPDKKPYLTQKIKNKKIYFYKI